jgi:acetolactate synthase-1/2/3 large subunit
MMLTGAEILIRCLTEQGTDVVFGYPGGSVLNVYDALYRHREEICHILTSHEQGAVHAADGYARATGRTGVCIATSGPGATNLVTGIATAYMDSVPVVAITCNVSTNLLGRDSFQEVDITGVTLPVTKHNFLVRDINKLADTVRRAFSIAGEGRPGPVLIDIPKDVTAMTAEYHRVLPRTVPKTGNPANLNSIEYAVKLLHECKKPLIYAGGGVNNSGAARELLCFAEKLSSPVACSLMGLGGFPGTHPLYTGMIGMHGTKASNTAVTECDMLVAVGARFSDRVVSDLERFAPDAKVIHLDIDPCEIGKNVKVYHHVLGDIKDVLKRLNQGIDCCERVEWTDRILGLKEKYPQNYSDGGRLKPRYIIERIYEVSKGDAIITTDVGQHQIWSAQYYKYTKPRTYISSGGLGTMGYGLGASIGAQIGRPGKRVFNITGDGCFRMNCIEIATAVKYNIPVITIVLNNHALGMVRQWQWLFYGRRFSQTSLDKTTDFVKLAEAYGAVGINLTRPEDVDGVLEKALGASGPVIVNCEIDRDEAVFPIVPPGKPLSESIME